MSQVIASAIGNALSAALVVTPTDGRDLKYFKAINKIAQIEFRKAGFEPSSWDSSEWKPESTHDKYWVAPLISVSGMSHVAMFEMLFSDGDRGYILEGFNIKITHYDDNFKPEVVASLEFKKDVDNYKALISSMISEFRLLLAKKKLTSLFDGNSLEAYRDFSNAVNRVTARRGNRDWIPGLKSSFAFGMGMMTDWTCSKDFDHRRSEVALLFNDFLKSKKVEMDLEFTPDSPIINAKTIADTLVETFPNLRQDNDTVTISIVNAKFTGSTLKVTVRFTKK
ncbi:hypothetical protein KFS98_003762 [Salmonella enterica]|nr:hypothetical protein [Salmonella enterica]